MSKLAELRVCASCEWVFKNSESPEGCPKCGFGSYGARYVYGKKAYKYEETQEPWLEQQMIRFRCKLLSEIPKRHRKIKHVMSNLIGRQR